MQVGTEILEQKSSSTSALRARRQSTLMRSVNRYMRQLTDPFGSADPIMFFCECGTANCYAVIPMTGAAFDLKCGNEPGWLLLEGHRPSKRWGRTDTVPIRCPANSEPTNGCR